MLFPYLLAIVPEFLKIDLRMKVERWEKTTGFDIIEIYFFPLDAFLYLLKRIIRLK